MMFLAGLLVVGVLILLYLFFAPFYLEINSAMELYTIRFQHLVSINLKIKENIVVETRIFGWKHESVLNGPSVSAPAKVKRSKTVKRREFPLKKAIRVASSFKVNKCYVDIDFGDMQLNGILFPFFAWLSWHSKKQIQVNFTGRTVLILELENSVARMSRAWLGSDQ